MSNLDKLIDQVRAVCGSWTWLSENDFGSREAVISTAELIELEKQYENFMEDYVHKAEPESTRARRFATFAYEVISHIDGYTVPQYGDSPDDNVELWSSEDCHKQAEKYIKRRNTSRRPDEKKLDILKAVHYLQMAYEKMENETTA